MRDRTGDSWQLENATGRAVVLTDGPAIESTGLLHRGLTTPRTQPTGVRPSIALFPEVIDREPLLTVIRGLRLQAREAAGVLPTSGNDHLPGLRGGGGEDPGT